nr:hypothetical protein [uncultured Bdellovibrio sp.]
MKKQIKLAMAAMILFGSVNAMADIDDDIYNEIQRTKIETFAESFDIRSDIENIKKETDKLIDILGTSGPEGSLQESGLGQLSDIAQRNFEKSQQTENIDDLHELLDSSNQVKAALKQIKAHYNIK